MLPKNKILTETQKKWRATPSIPITAMIAHAMQGDRERFLKDQNSTIKQT